MYARIMFEDYQQISKEELKEISLTLSDIVSFKDMYKDETGKISTLGWRQTFDPNDKELIPGDNGKSEKTLVYPSNYVQLDNSKEYIADIDLFFSKHPHLKIKMRGLPQTPTISYSGVIQQIMAIQEKFETALKNFDKQIEFNEKVDVHVGNLGLLNINQVGYCLDYCTEKLQDRMNEGWRLLSVCPQPDQRRPDYIIGRYNPEQSNVECMTFSS